MGNLLRIGCRGGGDVLTLRMAATAGSVCLRVKHWGLMKSGGWKSWQKIARTMPIAVIARPGYEGAARASLAGAWLGRFRRSAASLKHRAGWSAPALIHLRFDPDPRSATATRLRGLNKIDGGGQSFLQGKCGMGGQMNVHWA